MALAGCLVGTEIQLSYWQNSIKLFRHAIEVTTDNFVAYTCLGETLRDLGMKQGGHDALRRSGANFAQQPGGTI